MLGFPIVGLPGPRTARTAQHRLVFRDHTMQCDLSGGKVVDGTLSRDQGNTSDVGYLRPGLLMGKVTSSGKYAPSVIGLTNAAYASGTSLTVTAAAATELARRVGASGAVRIIGPAAASGAIAEETLTYSAIAGTTVTITALTNAYVSGSLIVPADGSEDILTFIPEGWNKQVVDIDGNSTDVPFEWLPIGGVVQFAQLLPAVTDASLKQWIKDQLRTASGLFVFDADY